jgi:hypothetical protein
MGIDAGKVWLGAERAVAVHIANGAIIEIVKTNNSGKIK